MASPFSSDAAAKKAMAEYIAAKLGLPAPSPGWSFVDVDPGGTPPTDPPAPGPGDLDTETKIEEHTLDTLKRLFAEIRNGHPGS